jgi:hypothetical protein
MWPGVPVDGDDDGVDDGVEDGELDAELDGEELGVVDGVVDGELDAELDTDVLGELLGGVVPPPQGALLIVHAVGALPVPPVLLNSMPTAEADAPAASGPAHDGLCSW